MIILNYLNFRHTNIVYRVKTCYKIKIGFTLIPQHYYKIFFLST